MWTSNRVPTPAIQRARSRSVSPSHCWRASALRHAPPPRRLPRSTADAVTVSSLPESGELDPGTYLVTGFTVPFEITVPDGWESGGWFLFKALSEAGVAVNFQVTGYVPTDACAWKGAIVEVVRRLKPSSLRWQRRLRRDHACRRNHVGGFPGFEFDYSVESVVDINDCDEAKHLPPFGLGDQCARGHGGVNEHET